MALVVRAFPIVRPVSEVRAFLFELAEARKDDTRAFYRRFGVTHESAYLQETPHGPLLIVVTQLDEHAEAAQRYQAASEAFESWFKGEIRRLTGVDPDRQPLGPPTTELFAWEAASDVVRACPSS